MTHIRKVLKKNLVAYIGLLDVLASVIASPKKDKFLFLCCFIFLPGSFFLSLYPNHLCCSYGNKPLTAVVIAWGPCGLLSFFFNLLFNMNVVYILQGSKGLGKMIAFIWRKSCQIDTKGSFTVCKLF